MESRLTKELLKTAILPILFIFIFIQACGPTPATALTDTTKLPVSFGSALVSAEPILGNRWHLTISGISASSVTVGISNNTSGTGGTTQIGTKTLTNISGDFGNYTYGNGEMTLSVKVADSGSVTVNLTRLETPYLLLENITCE